MSWHMECIAHYMHSHYMTEIVLYAGRCAVVGQMRIHEGFVGRCWSFEFTWPCSTNSHRLIGLFGLIGGCRRRPLSTAHAAATRSGGPVPRTGPDLPRAVGTRRNASKSRNRRASPSLIKPGVSVAALRQPPGRTNARVSGSALAVSRTSTARPIWTR